MLRNHLTVALRNFLRHPIYSIINVSSLVLGLTCGIFIFLWILDEVKYDTYHPDNDRVYKVMWNNNYLHEGITTDHWTSGLLAEELKAQIPEIEQAARVSWSGLKLFKYGNFSGYEPGDYADKTIFEAINLTLVEGNVLHALPDNNSVAISQKLAAKLFKNEHALEKNLTIDGKPVTVTAVFKDLPENTTEKFEFILPFELTISNLATYDGSGWQFTIVKLDHKDHKELAEVKMAELVRKQKEPSNTPPPPPFLQSMPDWHLHDNYANGQPSGGRISYVVAFSLVAVIIMVIACINFMNLSTARSANRSREVGIRKVSGATRQVLVRQFLSESMLLAFLSLTIALLFVHLLLPLFNSFTEKQVEINYTNPLITGSLIGITLLTGFVAGSYPALFLSSFRPASVLKGNLQSVFAGAGLRKGLVVFQFALSMVIIIVAVVVSQQIDFMRNKDLGFDQNNVLIIYQNEEIVKNFTAFRNALLQNANIESVARADCHPMEINGETWFDWSGKSPDDDTYFNDAVCDYDYLKTLGFTFVKGRNFSPDFPSDSSAIIITEEAASRMGVSNPIGQHLTDYLGEKWQVIGIVKDFNNLSIQEALHPVSFRMRVQGEVDRGLTMFVRYKPGTFTASFDHVKTTYKEYAPAFPIQYWFVDKQFEEQFQTELIASSLAKIFTAIAIIISCLGLFGLASFATERRTKEIGIRKVLGATVSGLSLLLCKDFTRLIFYAIVLGSPVAYYLMQQFLEGYPYHTQLTVFTFVLPAFLMFFTSIGIVLFLSMQAALANPVNSLRSE